MDLKSLNVLVDADMPVAKLVDFGLARVASSVRLSTGGRRGKVGILPETEGWLFSSG